MPFKELRVTKPVREKLGSGASSHLDTFIAAPRRLIFTKDASLYGQRREMSRTGVEPEAGMICSAKRIRSLYLPRMTGVTPGLSTTTPPQGPGLRLHYRWRDYAPLQSRPPCRSSLIAPGSRSHSVSPHRAYHSKTSTAVSAISPPRFMGDAGSALEDLGDGDQLDSFLAQLGQRLPEHLEGCLMRVGDADRPPLEAGQSGEPSELTPDRLG
jgi:hypothetical protein